MLSIWIIFCLLSIEALTFYMVDKQYRDIRGIKSLYYSKNKKTIAYTSEEESLAEEREIEGVAMQ